MKRLFDFLSTPREKRRARGAARRVLDYEWLITRMPLVW